MLYIIITIIAWGLWTIFDKKGVENLHPLQAQLWGYLVATLNIPVYLTMVKSSGLSVKVDWKSFGWLAAAMVMSSVASFELLSALKQRDATEVIGYTSVYPIVTMVLGVIFLGEALTVNRAFGILLAVAGVYVLSR